MRTSRLIQDTVHVCGWMVIFLTGACLPAECLDHSLNLGGAVEDADISPNGEYVAAAVRKCAVREGNRTCTLEMEVWSSAGAKRVANQTLLTNVGEVRVGIRFSADGHTLVVSDGQGKLHLWRMPDLAHIYSIDLGLSGENVWALQEKANQETDRLSHQIGASMAPIFPRVVQMESSPSSAFIAVVIAVGRAEMIRVFDLMSGKLLHSWSFMEAFRVAPVSWSQDGKRIAVFLPSTRWMKNPQRTDPANLLIYDVASGQQTAKLEIKEEWDSDVWASEAPAERRGRVMFAGSNLIVSTRRTPAVFFRPTLRVLDSRTGQTIRKISAAGTGVRDPIAVSADGKVILGFVGHVRKVTDRELFRRDIALDARICLWEMPAGKLIFASGELSLIPNRASFRLNARGNWVIGFDQGTTVLLLQIN